MQGKLIHNSVELSIATQYVDNWHKSRVILLHAMEALGVRGGIAPAHS
jgi:hypothetical protein